MADTIREQIIAAYVTRLAAWTTANGYNYGCGASVFRAMPVVNPSEAPACALWPEAEEAEKRYNKMVCTMPVKVEAIAEVGTTNPSIIQEKLLGDAITIMTDPSVTVSSKIDSITYKGGGPAAVPDGRDTVVAVSAEFEIKYKFVLGNPETQ